MGQVLYVDLDDSKFKKETLNADLIRDFVGGLGVDLWLAYHLIKPETTALSPGNAIIISCGPLVSTRIQAPRWTATSKLPLTGAVAFGSGGMGFGVQLKRAGYDHLVITGRAQKPVYLRISDDDVELCDATYLWGKDTVETTDALWQRYGKAYSVTAIGQAGENLVKMALALVDKTSSIGKGGLGAVMGFKNLKAIIVKGTSKVQIHDQEGFDKACDEVLSRYKEDTELKNMVELGKMYEPAAIRVPYKNFTELFPEEQYYKIYGVEPYLDKVKGKRTGCTTCRYPCKDVLEVKLGEYQGLTVHVSSIIGRLWNLGVQCGAGSMENAVKLIDVANRYGVCTQTFSPVMNLAVELYERGIITKKDTGGIVLKADFPTTLLLLERVAFRQGIGDVLAEGTPGIIAKFGKECERYSVNIKGLDHQIDPRISDFSMATFEQLVNPEGGSVEPAKSGSKLRPSARGFSIEKVKEYCDRMGISSEARARILDRPSGFNVGRLTRYAEDFYGVLTSLGICEYRSRFFNWDKLAELYSLATGMATTANDMKSAGERIWNLFKIMNVREGFNRKDDRFPEKWLEPLALGDGRRLPLTDVGGETITAGSLKKMLNDYYDERGWDINSGVPSESKLMELGLGWVLTGISKLMNDYKTRTTSLTNK